jgi:hypothetical protein
MRNSNSILTSSDKDAQVHTAAHANELGDLSKLPRELRDIIYESMLANVLEQNVDVEEYFLRPDNDLPPIFQAPQTLKNVLLLFGLYQYSLAFRGPRTPHLITSFLSASKASISVRSMELQGMDNIRDMSAQTNKFLALRRLTLAFNTRLLIAIDPEVNAWTRMWEAMPVADVVQRYNFKKLLACTTLRDVTLEGCKYAQGAFLSFGAGKVLGDLGKWLDKECEKKEMNVNIRVVGTWITRHGVRRLVTLYRGRC